MTSSPLSDPPANPLAVAQPVEPVVLTSENRRSLRALAHKLSPVVMIGSNGLTAAVINAIDEALTSHRLIKIRANHDERPQREVWLTEICAHPQLNCASVQHLGKLFIVYRPRPGDPPGLVALLGQPVDAPTEGRRKMDAKRGKRIPARTQKRRTAAADTVRSSATGKIKTTGTTWKGYASQSKPKIASKRRRRLV